VANLVEGQSVSVVVDPPASSWAPTFSNLAWITCHRSLLINKRDINLTFCLLKEKILNTGTGRYGYVVLSRVTD
jgi:hypothetical protein